MSPNGRVITFLKNIKCNTLPETEKFVTPHLPSVYLFVEWSYRNPYLSGMFRVLNGTIYANKYFAKWETLSCYSENGMKGLVPLPGRWPVV